MGASLLTLLALLLVMEGGTANMSTFFEGYKKYLDSTLSRICPGKDFGQNATYLGVVSLLSKFTIAKALDKNGKEIVPEVEYNNGLIRFVIFSLLRCEVHSLGMNRLF